MNSFLSEAQLQGIGFACFGKNVLISNKTSIYGAQKIYIGDNVRIDDFCILSGSIKLYNYIHIAAYTSLFGGEAGITFEDYTGISSHSSVYAVSDDYTGRSMTNPMIPDKFKPYLRSAPVIIKKYSNIGASCVILPGVEMHEGVVVTPMSLCNRSLKEWSIYSGIPAKRLVDRSRDLLKLEEEFKKSIVVKE